MKTIEKQRLFNSITNTNIFGTAKSIRYLSYFLIDKPAGKVFCENIHGFSLWLDPIEDKFGVEHDLYYLGTYEKGTIHVIDAYLKKDDNFLDVGANIGFISLYAAQINTNGKVFSFEANPHTYQILKANIEGNNFKNIVAFDFALGSENSTAQIFPHTLESNRGGASLVQSELNKGDNGITIAVKKFDELPESKLPIAMMKLDVEGFEMEVLKGATEFFKGDNAPALIVECSESRNNLNFTPVDLYRYLLSINKYKVYKLQKGKERISKLVEVQGENDIPFHDNLFCFLPNQLDRIKHILA